MGMATTKALLQIFGSLSLCMQEDRILLSQDFNAAEAWRISSEHIESGPGAFPCFSSWRALANSPGVKSPDILLSAGVGILHSSVTSLDTSRADSRSFVSYTPFLTNYEAIELAETGQGRGECLDLPVKLLMMFHASRLECVKSMVLTASDQRSLRFSSSAASRAVAAVLVASPCGARRKVW